MPEKGDWTPYDRQVEFELAEFLFKKVQMSNSDISNLMNLWAADLLAEGREPPFADHNDLLNVIDSSVRGDVPWQSFKVSWQGDIPEGSRPSHWMKKSYDVWYRDPREVIGNILLARTSVAKWIMPHFVNTIARANGYSRILCQEIGHGDIQYVS